MNLDTVLTFFSSYKHCAKILFSKELIRKVICVGKCEEFFQAGSTCTSFYKLHTQYGKKPMCWLNIFIWSSYPQGQDNRRIKTHIFLKSGFKILPANLLNVHVYKYSFFPQTTDLRSHWIRSRLNCCSAPMETCLTLLSIRKFIREVATCLHADMQEVLATFSCNTIRFTRYFRTLYKVLCTSFTNCCQLYLYYHYV